MEKFEILDIAGDVGLKAFGESKQEVFVHTALGMYSLITNTDVLKDQKSITVSVESHALDGLLVSWLNELIFHFDAYGFIGKRIVVAEFTLPPLKGEGRVGMRLLDLRLPYMVRNLIPSVMKGNCSLKLPPTIG